MGKLGAIQDPNNSIANVESLPALLPREFPDRYMAQRCLFVEDWVVQRLEFLHGLFSLQAPILAESSHVVEAN